MEQLYTADELGNKTVETLNATTKPRLGWLDYLLWLLFGALCLWSLTHSVQLQAAPQPGQLVVVTKFVCQPTPTVDSVLAPYQTVP